MGSRTGGVFPALAGLLVVVALSAGLPLVRLVDGPSTALIGANSPEEVSGYGELALSFEPNVGQSDPSVRFVAQVGEGSVSFAPSGVLMTLPGADADDDPTDTRINFVGANPEPLVVPGETAAGTVNYFVGDDPSAWRTGVQTYQDISYKSLFPGVDLAYEGSEDALKGTYTVAAGADPATIRWQYEGAEEVRVDKAGNLQVRLPGVPEETASATITEAAPLAWQDIAGRRQAVDTQFQVAPDDSVGFILGSYDSAHPLVIDPTLTYATYLGGGEGDAAHDIAIDDSGAAYVIGQTASRDFPTANAVQPRSGDPGNAQVPNDVFVTKLNPQGSALIYSTYLGGDFSDRGYGIAVDSTGSAYLTGETSSTDFPTTEGVFDRTRAGTVPRSDAFVTKLTSTGGLVYSTYLGGGDIGGRANDIGNAIAVDADGNAYVTGNTFNIDFPVTDDPFQRAQDSDDAFVTKVNPTGSALVYSTFLGGDTGTDTGLGIAVAPDGSAYVSGVTASTNFPTANAYQASPGGGETDAFVTKLDPSGSSVAYSTYLGGIEVDRANDIAIDAAGAAHVVGTTASIDFPTVNALQSEAGSKAGSSIADQDGFVTKLDPSGSNLAYSTYLAGDEKDEANSIALDAAGAAHVTGSTESVDFPLVEAFRADCGIGFRPTQCASSDAFIAKVSPAGLSLVYSSYLGGDDGSTIRGETGNGIVIDNDGSAYVAGMTDSEAFPTTFGAFQPERAGTDDDAFIAKVTPDDDEPPPPSTTTSTTGPTTSTSTSTTLPPTGDGPPTIEGVQPGSSPTAGGIAVRIYGDGLEETTEVLLGTQPALEFTVVDSDLITAIVPPATGGEAANNTSVDITVVDDQGSDVGSNDEGEQLGLYYTNATITATPDAGLSYGDEVTVALRGYEPNGDGVLALANPLFAFIEDPPAFPFGPPPYVTLFGFKQTDEAGSYDETVTLIEGFNEGLDPNAVCPPSQITADHGLPFCTIEYSTIAVGPVDTPVRFVDNPTPAAPTLSLFPTTADVGDSVDLSGVNWNAAPQFGSDTTPEDPGETELIVELCDTGLSTCSSAPADAMVDLVRYRDSDPDELGVQGEFSGASLLGSFTVDEGSGCAPTCVVRVSQQRFDPALDMAVDEFIVATADLTVTTDSAPTTTTSSTSSTTLPPTTTTSTSTTTSTTLPSNTTTTLPPTTTTTLPPTTTTTSTTLPPTSTTTSTTLPPTTTSTSTTMPPDGDLVVTIDDTVVTDGSRGQVRGTVTCEAGALFLVELDLAQDGSSAHGTARGFCSGSPQSFVIGFATTGSSFSSGDAEACVATRTGQLGSRTISDSNEVCKPVVVELRSR